MKNFTLRIFSFPLLFKGNNTESVGKSKIDVIGQIKDRDLTQDYIKNCVDASRSLRISKTVFTEVSP